MRSRRHGHFHAAHGLDGFESWSVQRGIAALALWPPNADRILAITAVGHALRPGTPRDAQRPALGAADLRAWLASTASADARSLVPDGFYDAPPLVQSAVAGSRFALLGGLLKDADLMLRIWTDALAATLTAREDDGLRAALRTLLAACAVSDLVIARSGIVGDTSWPDHELAGEIGVPEDEVFERLCAALVLTSRDLGGLGLRAEDIDPLVGRPSAAPTERWRFPLVRDDADGSVLLLASPAELLSAALVRASQQVGSSTLAREFSGKLTERALASRPRARGRHGLGRGERHAHWRGSALRHRQGHRCRARRQSAHRGTQPPGGHPTRQRAARRAATAGRSEGGSRNRPRPRGPCRRRAALRVRHARPRSSVRPMGHPLREPALDRGRATTRSARSLAVAGGRAAEGVRRRRVRRPRRHDARGRGDDARACRRRSAARRLGVPSPSGAHGCWPPPGASPAGLAVGDREPFGRNIRSARLRARGRAPRRDRLGTRLRTVRVGPAVSSADGAGDGGGHARIHDGVLVGAPLVARLDAEAGRRRGGDERRGRVRRPARSHARGLHRSRRRATRCWSRVHACPEPGRQPRRSRAAARAGALVAAGRGGHAPGRRRVPGRAGDVHRVVPAT